MPSRLEIKHGLVAERDRLSTSADTLGVSQPGTGSQSRTKGVLHVAVSSTALGPRAREATALVAETVRREYYYDESAGVPVCLEKAVKSANRRLRGAREGFGLPPGALGLGLAVVRGNELYLATIGGVEAYLVRSARLLMPDRRQVPGLPSTEDLRVDVWRGELAIGDCLLLVSRNLTEAVGTEQLKSAVLTLHPQAAVEHLHHLFVAAGGEGSDAVIAVEAREVASRNASRPAGGATVDPYGDLAGQGDHPRRMGRGGGLGRAAGGWLDRAIDALPRRSTSPDNVSASVTKAESHRRAAVGLLAFLGVLFLLGLGVWLLPRGGERQVESISSAEQAILTVQDRLERARRTATTDEAAALDLYREAWRALGAAKGAGLGPEVTDPIEREVLDGLGSLHGASEPDTRAILRFDGDVDPVGLALGPDGAPYYLDAANGSVTRVEVDDDRAVEVVREGDGSGDGIGQLRLLDAGGPDVVIVDDRGEAWRWRPSNRTGRGTLARLNIAGNDAWGDDVTDIGTLLLPSGLYNLYVSDPSARQVLRYGPTADGSGFSAPQDYLLIDSDEVGSIRQLHLDRDLYTLSDEGLTRYTSGRLQGDFGLALPPDDADIRPGHDYTLLDGSNPGGRERLYLFDDTWDRFMVFDMASGAFVEQWASGPDSPSMEDVRGMYVVEPTRSREPATIYWVSPEGLFASALRRPAAVALGPG